MSRTSESLKLTSLSITPASTTLSLTPLAAVMPSIDLTAHSKMMTTSSFVTTVLSSSRMSSSVTVSSSSNFGGLNSTMKVEETADVQKSYVMSSKISTATSEDGSASQPSFSKKTSAGTAPEISADFRLTVGDGASSKHVITKGKRLYTSLIHLQEKGEANENVKEVPLFYFWRKMKNVNFHQRRIKTCGKI